MPRPTTTVAQQIIKKHPGNGVHTEFVAARRAGMLVDLADGDKPPQHYLAKEHHRRSHTAAATTRGPGRHGIGEGRKIPHEDTLAQLWKTG